MVAFGGLVNGTPAFWQIVLLKRFVSETGEPHAPLFEKSVLDLELGIFLRFSANNRTFDGA
jgi:hypothetical protein